MRSSVILALLAAAYVASGAAILRPGRNNTHVNPLEAQVEAKVNHEHVASNNTHANPLEAQEEAKVNHKYVANLKRDATDTTTSDSAAKGSVLKILPDGTMVIEMDGEVEDRGSETSTAFKLMIPADLKIVLPEGGLPIGTDNNTHTISVATSHADGPEKRDADINDPRPCFRCAFTDFLHNKGHCPIGSRSCPTIHLHTGEPERCYQTKVSHVYP